MKVAATEISIHRHATRRHAYVVRRRRDGELIGIVRRLRAHLWAAELAGDRPIASCYETRNLAIGAVLRNAGTLAWVEVSR